MKRVQQIALYILLGLLALAKMNLAWSQDDLFADYEESQSMNEATATEEKDHERVILNPQARVAVADIKVGHKTAKLVFPEDVARDIITSAMVEQGSYSVIDWSRLNAVLFRRNLEWSDVVKEENQRKEIKDVLLNDYFLTGTISAYSERWEYDSGAFSKSKTQISSVKVDLFIKDAITNEIIAAASEQGDKSKKISQSLGFGASGGADASLAMEALNIAAAKSANILAQKLAAKLKGNSNAK